MIRPAVGQIVAGDGGDHHVSQAQAGGGFGDTIGFVELEGFGLPFRHGAKAAGARADVAQDHERGGFLRPAFQAVGALGAFADSFQMQIVDQLRGELQSAAGRQIFLQPPRQARARGRMKRRIELDQLHDYKSRKIVYCTQAQGLQPLQPE